MPVGNQQVWDKGIGEPATNMLMQSTQQSGPSNFNPNALAQQPVPQQAQQQSPQGNGVVPQGGLQTGVKYYFVNGKYMTEEEYQQHLASGGQATNISGLGSSKELSPEARAMAMAYRSRMGL